MFVATKCCCWYCCCQNEDFFKQIQLHYVGFVWICACLHEWRNHHCLVPKAAAVKWQLKIATLHNTLWFLGGNHAPHVRNRGKLRNKGKFHLSTSTSQKFGNFALKKSESHLTWTLQTIKIQYDMSNSPSFLPMSPNVLHFRAVCHTAGSKRNCQNPPTVSVFRGPPQTRTEKLEAKTATNGGKELWIFGCVDPTSMVITAFCPALPPKQMAKEGIQVHLHDGPSAGICRAQCHHESD